jgi:hypothetical protein
MARISNKGTNWKPWSSFNNSRYKSAEQMVRNDVNEQGFTGTVVPWDENAKQTGGDGGGILSNISGGISWLLDVEHLKRILYGLIGLLGIGFGVMLLVKDAKR